MKMKSPAVKKTPVGKQKTPNPPKSGKKSIGQNASPKIGKTPPSTTPKGNKKQTPFKGALKGKKGASPKNKLEDLSESDIDSDEDFGMDGEEFGPMSDDSSSEEGDESSPVQGSKKGGKSAQMEVDEEDDEEDDEAPALVSSKQAAGKNKSPKKGEQASQPASKTNGEKYPAVDTSKSIYVSNLAPGVTEDDVRKLFSDFGVVESVVLPKNPHTQKMKGYGFVNFAKEQSVTEAVAKQGLKLQGKVLTVAKRKENKSPNKAESNSDNNRSKAVYVGNMPFSMVNNENIRRLFADCGKIDSVAILPKKGSAIVNFKEVDSVQEALKKSGSQVEGRPMIVRSVADTSRTVYVDHLKPTKGGILEAAKCLKELLADCEDIASLTVKKKADSEFTATIEFESPESAKKVVAKSGSEVGQGVVTVALEQQKGQVKPVFKNQKNKGANNQQKKSQGAGSPKKTEQTPDKGTALKNKTKEKFQKKKEALKKKASV